MVVSMEGRCIGLISSQVRFCFGLRFTVNRAAGPRGRAAAIRRLRPRRIP
jgi:hypothetical protein